ncbi:MAG: hypothetical protein DRG78_04435 [Epsilonproteobacteria bacterium]|nr:MAG: hypothetical protein DRG78_04435 [Campylobacterota bacterium]
MRTQITKTIETETGHRLFRYSGKCSHLHGHRLVWHVTVSSPELDHTGFVMDYKDLKKVLMSIIDPFDHAFVMGDEDPLYLQFGEKIFDLLKATDGKEPRLFIVDFNPTSENILNYVSTLIIKALNSLNPEFKLEKMVLWETSSSYCEKIFD